MSVAANPSTVLTDSIPIPITFRLCDNVITEEPVVIEIEPGVENKRSSGSWMWVFLLILVVVFVVVVIVMVWKRRQGKEGNDGKSIFSDNPDPPIFVHTPHALLSPSQSTARQKPVVIPPVLFPPQRPFQTTRYPPHSAPHHDERSLWQ